MPAADGPSSLRKRDGLGGAAGNLGRSMIHERIPQKADLHGPSQDGGSDGPLAGVSQARLARLSGAARIALLNAGVRGAANSAVARLARENARLARYITEPHQPEQQAFDLTGRYEADPGSGPRITLQLNQAGTHIEGRWQERDTTDQAGEHAQTLQHGTLTAELDDPETRSFRSRRSRDDAFSPAQWVGTLRGVDVGGVPFLEVADSGGRYRLRKIGGGAFMSEQAIADVPDVAREIVRAQQTAPLDQTDVEHLQRHAANIRSLATEFAAEGTPSVRRIKAILIDEEVQRFVGDVAPEQMPLAAYTLQRLLRSYRVASGDSDDTVWDLLQVAVSENPGFETNAIVGAFGFTAAATGGISRETYHYEWEGELYGGGGNVGVVGAGIVAGPLRIRRVVAERGGRRVEWEHHYWMAYSTMSGGPALQAQVPGSPGGSHGSGTIDTPFEWQPPDFNGPVSVLSIDFAVGVGAGHDWTLSGEITFHGAGNRPAVTSDTTGHDWVGGQIGGGLTVSAGGGWVSDLGRDEAISHVRRRHDDPSAPREFAGVHAPVEELFFNVDDATLTGEGFQQLRAALAQERVAFGDTSATLEIDAYTSTTGTRRHNQPLSEARARNVYTAIQDILGTGLQIPAERTHVVGHGEEPAAEEAERLHYPNPHEEPYWRRVTVRVNGRVIATL
jgi:outer membrane protein OmpA-like peptidoglycan-associated protein